MKKISIKLSRNELVFFSNAITGFIARNYKAATLIELLCIDAIKELYITLLRKFLTGANNFTLRLSLQQCVAVLFLNSKTDAYFQLLKIVQAIDKKMNNENRKLIFGK